MDGDLIDELEGQAPVLVHLITLTLPSATVRWTFEGGVVVWDSNTYAFADATYGSLGSISSLEDGATGNATPFDFTVLCDSAGMTALIAPASQGSLVTVHLGAVDPSTGLLVGEPDLLFRGELDQPSISAGPSQGLSFQCITEETRMLEPNEEQRLTSSFHASVWPGEEGCDFVTDLLQRVYWREDDVNTGISR